MTRWRLILVPTLALLVGCGAAHDVRVESAAIQTGDEAPVAYAAEARDEESSGKKAYDRNNFAAAAPVAPPMQAPADAAPDVPPEAKGPRAAEKHHLVYTATFNMAVYQVEIGLDRTEALAKELGGYLSSRGDNEIIIRVPREKFNVAIDRIAQLGEVLHRDVKALDVTDDFVDTESRLRNARVMRERLQALLQKAAVKEAIVIEKELGRVTGEIEVLEGKLKLLSDRIAYSTITVRYSGRGDDGKLRITLPFPWLHTIGLQHLLNLSVPSTDP